MTNPTFSSDTSEIFSDRVFIKELRQQMIKFATQQLRDNTLAEDAVQEALMGALKNKDSFRAQSAFKTWVYAILKNKVIDIIRTRQRQAVSLDQNVENESDFRTEHYFNEQDMWSSEHKPSDWGNPETSLLGKDFWRVFDACLDHLPPQQGRVFMMREMIELDSHEICREIGISVSNLNVMLYRARLRLRECLELHWFSGSKAK